ncbi:MAG TPA: alpha/beta fold hydrolase [Streptosporangiaceae bacterium]|jgi:polyhydroxyalkanoate synthase|nr:alpha/beta fold hydrolase [Streptosporangiaceae bacterium]
MTGDDGAPGRESGQESAGDVAAALDMLLADGALGVLRRFRPDGAAARLAASLARRPQLTGLHLAALASELGRIATGSSELAPDRKDRRFTDPAWAQNPLLRRTVQAYLAAGQAATDLLATAELDWRDDERLRFVLSNLIAAAAPSNSPLLNPAAVKALVDTGGLSVVRGLRALVTDLAQPPRVPAMVAPDAFEVGRDLAVTPGSVVYRTEMLELIQYAPVTAQVCEYPVLIVPPMINKYYITDLAPGRSMIEYLVSQGHQVFAISWRNPDARHRAFDLDSYGAAVTGALDAALAVTRADRVSICALCSGGIVSSMVAAHLAEIGGLDRVASLCLGVTVLDQARAGTAGAMIDETTAAAAVAASAARGYLDGRALAEVFAWLRPDDLIWNYWVNNYLQGRTPQPFDILYWNADTTRLPAALHRDFIRLALDNALTRPGAATMLGSPVDLSKVDADTYVIAGIADHLCPWQSCYRSTQLLGGHVTFVLSTSGHIASMVNPPGNPKATFRTAAENPADPRAWLDAADTVSGSWWPHYSDWLAARSGGERRKPAAAGRKGYDVLAAAPGTYVHGR